MKKRLSHISIHQSSKVMAIVYLLLAALICVPAAFVAYFSSRDPQYLLLLLLPLFYMVVGYILFAVITFLYNWAAKWCGGIEYTTTDTDARG